MTRHRSWRYCQAVRKPHRSRSEGGGRWLRLRGNERNPPPRVACGLARTCTTCEIVLATRSAPELCPPPRPKISSPPAQKREAERRKAHCPTNVRVKRGRAPSISFLPACAGEVWEGARRPSALTLAALTTGSYPDGSAPEPGFLKESSISQVFCPLASSPQLSTLRADRSFCRSTGDPGPPGSGWHIRARAPRLAPLFQACLSGKGALDERDVGYVTRLGTNVKGLSHFLRPSREFVDCSSFCSCQSKYLVAMIGCARARLPISRVVFTPKKPDDPQVERIAAEVLPTSGRSCARGCAPLFPRPSPRASSTLAKS